MTLEYSELLMTKEGEQLALITDLLRYLKTNDQ